MIKIVSKVSYFLRDSLLYFFHFSRQTSFSLLSAIRNGWLYLPKDELNCVSRQAQNQSETYIHTQFYMCKTIVDKSNHIQVIVTPSSGSMLVNEWIILQIDTHKSSKMQMVTSLYKSILLIQYCVVYFYWFFFCNIKPNSTVSWVGFNLEFFKEWNSMSVAFCPIQKPHFHRFSFTLHCDGATIFKIEGWIIVLCIAQESVDERENENKKYEDRQMIHGVRV